MWVLSAPFDASEVGKVDFERQKLLKPGSSYVLGRKGHPLIINHNRVSRDHCEFIVGSHTLDDVADPDMRPTLEVVNRSKKDKNMGIYRGEEDDVPVEIETSGAYQLQDGDRIALVNHVDIKISWRPLCAYSSTTRGKGTVSSEACAALGIKLVQKPHPAVTHHLMPHYVADLSTAASLLSLACLVKPEWLQEILRLGSTPASTDGAVGTQLEHAFALPSESAYRPTFSPSLLPKQKTFAVWSLNEARLNMFATCRFLCIREKATAADTLLGEAVHRGAGNLENFDVHQGTARFRQALRRGFSKAAGKGMVVVADADAMQAAAGREMWEEYVNEAKSCSLEILPPSKVVQAILDADVQSLLPSASNNAGASAAPSRSMSPLPDRVPNTIADEPSVGTDDSLLSAPTRKPLVRRVTRSVSVSREPSVAPPEPEVAPRPRRALTRLVRNDPPFITGLDDPSAVIDGASIPAPTPIVEPEPDYTAPPPPRSRLKRRVGVANPDGAVWGSALAPMSGIAETVEEEPPLKKFKALFDASAPESSGWDALQSGSGVEYLLALDTGISQTQSESLGLGMSTSAEEVPRTAVVREEEEEMTQSQVPGGRRKRALEVVDEDAEMEVEPPAKRQATGGRAVSVAPAPTAGKPRSTMAATVTATEKKGGAGAPVGQPDTDSAFLKAIASTKRGKKTEDVFDREFNKLKISKPEVTVREPEEEWKVLEEFGDDAGIRGNFMTVVEIEVFRRDGRGQEREPLREWGGKPDFKKFKKKLTSLRRGAKVEVFVSEENDYGMGSAYWKGSASQRLSQTQNANFSSQPQMQTQFDDDSQDAPPRRKTPARARSAFDSEGEDATPAPARKARKGSAVPKKAVVKAKAAPKKQALFLDSDDDMDVDGGDAPAAATGAGASEAEAEAMTLEAESPVRPVRTGRTAARGKKAAPTVVDDDSDGGAVFKGFKGRKAKAGK